MSTEKTQSRLSKYSSPWYFFALTFTLTWVFWIPAALSGKEITTFSVGVLIALGGLFGKVLPAVIFPYLTQGSEGWRDFWRRVIDFRRIGLGWYAVILISFPLFSALGVLTDVLTGGSVPLFETARHFLMKPLTILPFAVFTLLFGPLPEELGWRGYVLDRLQARWNALASSLILGTLWLLWHLPLFFIEGSYHREGISLGSLRFGLSFGLFTLALSVLITWIYNNNGRSTLSAVLVHFMGNFTGEFLKLPVAGDSFKALWTVIAAITVVFIWGAKTLTRRQRST